MDAAPVVHSGGTSVAGAGHRAEMEQLKGQFLASLNHEIRTPLSGIVGMTDLLLESPLNDEQVEYVTVARDCAIQLLDMMNALLEFSALNAGQLRLESSEFHLPQVLDAVAGETEMRAAAKGLTFIYRAQENLPALAFGDPQRLRQLLSQLARNAVKFTVDGEVGIEAGADDVDGEGFSLAVHIRDTGIGIPSDKLKVIFDSFRQLEGGLSRSYNGLGLGLALADRLARLMGGHIEVSSEPGRGSVFEVQVPLRLPKYPLPGQVPAATRAPDRGARRILVVDDNRIAQDIVRHVLRQAGFDVFCASSGEAGVQAAAQSRYDLILMDLHMPDRDGYSASDAIRQLPGYAEVPILALSADDSSGHHERCRQHGMRGLLVKPVAKPELLGAIWSLLD